jgi:hypothetical protein
MAKRRPADFGKRLNTVYRIGAAHALFSEDGTFYMQLEQFPGALFDKGGFVLFRTEEEFNAALRGGHLRLTRPAEADHRMRINVRPGISSLPQYVLFSDHLVAQSGGILPDHVEVVRLLLDKGGFPRHRIAALLDVDQKIINDFAAGRGSAASAGAGRS